MNVLAPPACSGIDGERAPQNVREDGVDIQTALDDVGEVVQVAVDGAAAAFRAGREAKRAEPGRAQAVASERPVQVASQCMPWACPRPRGPSASHGRNPGAAWVRPWWIS